jgi:hypothetical protein
MTRTTKADLQEQLHQRDTALTVLVERLASLEFALEDAGWMAMSFANEREFSRDGLRRIVEIARIMFLKNPLIKRGVLVQSHYVFGQGVNVRCKDDAVNDVIQQWMGDARNRAELTSHQSRTGKEQALLVDGNIFFVFFTNKSTGRVLIRSIPFDEVASIATDPDDSKTPQFYKRVWNEERLGKGGEPVITAKSAYYPDWRYQPKTKRKTIGSIPIMWDSPVYHVKVGGLPDMRFGVSEVYAAIDWARAYKDFLEDWATLTRALSRYAYKMTTKGGAKGVAALKQRLGTTIGTGLTERNPPPTVGATAVMGEGNELEPMRIGGANVTAEDGRRMLLMVAAGLGLPETFFGDTSVGTLATAKSLDRPTELKMTDRQTLWIDIFKDILNYVVYQAAVAPQGVLRGKVDAVPEEDGTPRLLLDKKPLALDVDFPPLLEHEVQQLVSAITSAAPSVPDKRLIAKLLLVALGQDDVDALLDAMDFTLEPALPSDAEDDETEKAPATERMMYEAAREFRAALSEFTEKDANAA